MDNILTEQNPVELVKNAGEELFQYKKHSPEHNEVFEKYKNELFILLENYRALSNDERIQEKIDSFQKKALEVMRSLSATDYFDRFDGRFKPNSNDPHQIQSQSETHCLSLETRNKLNDEWDCILQKIESLKKREELKDQKKPNGDENNNSATPEQVESQESEEPLKPERKHRKPKPKKRGRKKDPKVKCRNKEIATYRAKNPKLSWKEIGQKFNVSADTARKTCNNPDN